MLAPTPDEATDGPDQYPHRASKALLQLRRTRWLRGSSARQTKQGGLRDTSRVQHRITLINVSNTTDHAHFTDDRLDMLQQVHAFPHELMNLLEKVQA